jgi:hypothetical protein
MLHPLCMEATLHGVEWIVDDEVDTH